MFVFYGEEAQYPEIRAKSTKTNEMSQLKKKIIIKYHTTYSTLINAKE